MKLELKYLAPYLPYKLMIDNQFDEKVIVMISSSSSSRNWIGLGAVIKWQIKCKPILRPLSDLKKPIDEEEPAVRFMDWMESEFELLYEDGNIYPFIHRDIYSLDIWEIPQNGFEYLLEHHFDVFGLIPEGLAIDINDLKK